jgi:hypothetical protein
MTTIKTTDGAEWKVAVNVGTVKRCMDETGLRLTDLFANEKKIGDFFSDDLRFCEVLMAVLRPQLEAAGKSADDFLAVIDGTVIESAAEALLVELANFFQEPRRGLLKQVLAKYQAAATKLRDAGAAAAQKKLDELNMEEMIAESQRTLTNSASSLPASAA